MKGGRNSGSEGIDQERKASDTNLLELHTLRRSVREKRVRRAVLRAEPELLQAARSRVFVPRAFREDG
ncbi:hypothetical protein NDU88_000977 [Pleurodeles waltl]|uniref:Uncharacterized protein n=1 Tax=Pleurodeles waltl TaxID=8319 RepID=A0AAV7V9X7_PLEWA|nr:hypothetical protein NDU88_000977 [Pleurodeles waltl]